MNSWEIYFSFFLCGLILATMAVGLVSAIIIPGLDRWSRSFFITYFSTLTLSSLVFMADLVLFMLPPFGTLGKTVDFFTSIISTITYPMLTFFLVHCCGEDWRKSVLFRSAVGLCFAYFVLLVVNQFTNIFYYYTPDNSFVTTRLYPLMAVPTLALLLLILAAVIRRRKKLPGRYFPAFLIALIPMIIAMLIHMFLPTFLLIDTGLALATIAMYSLILSDQIRQYTRQQTEIAQQQREIAEQQREIAQQHANVMVLQMRPHFIFNTMMSIYSLCNQDPQKARQVTMDFTTYLRKNFNAIASENTIPFSAELEHTRAYLAVEQAQFEGLLFVHFDTPHIRFRIPPLTLQPIAENAVKHGINPYAGPLHVSIQTRNTDLGSEIIIEDNGPGFDPSKGSESHITLSNIQQRLQIMCDGKMEILLREGGGTRVKLLLPPPHNFWPMNDHT